VNAGAWSWLYAAKAERAAAKEQFNKHGMSSTFTVQKQQLNDFPEHEMKGNSQLFRWVAFSFHIVPFKLFTFACKNNTANQVR